MTWFVHLWVIESSAASPADSDVTRREGQEDTGREEKEADAGVSTPKGTSGDTSAPTGFKVLGGFENKPAQKVSDF